MPSLTDIPFLSQYRAREQQIQGDEMEQLKQVSVLSQLAQQMQAQSLAREKCNYEKEQPIVVGPGSALVKRTGGAPVFENPNQRSSGFGTQTERAFKGLASAQRKVNSGVPLTEEEELDAQVYRAVLSQERVVTDPVTQQSQLMKPITIPSSITVGIPRAAVSETPSTTAPAQASDAAFIPGPRPMPTSPGAPPQNAPRKALDQPSEKELQGLNDASQQMQNLFSEFQPSYGGWALDSLAEGALALGRRLPEPLLDRFKQKGLVDQANWWQKYYNWSNDIRAAKFGLTLTGNELTAFNKANAKPSDTPEQIQAALKTQFEIMANKQRNRIAGLRAGGYNPEQIDQTAGPTRQAFDTPEEALDAVRSGRVSTAQVAIPKEVFRMPRSKDFDIQGVGKVRGTLRADGKYYVTQGGKTFRVDE